MKHSNSAGARCPGHALLRAGAAISMACIGNFLPANAQDADPLTPLETIIVIGSRIDTPEGAVTVEPERTQRLSTLPDLFSGTPGVLSQTNFGGIDHPRLSIRGSGLQRGTQPAGRGVELRLDGLPMTYADTSFDFVEWIEPLAFDRVVVLRGGRAELEGGAALGGVIDFRIRDGASSDSNLVRAEIGSNSAGRAQASIGGVHDAFSGYASASHFEQEGDRDFAAQTADRLVASGAFRPAPQTRVTANLVVSESQLQLPGPLTQAQINAGSQAAQPGNVAGDWRRAVDRARLALGAESQLAGLDVSAHIAYMDTDVDFRRRDIQIEENHDWSGRFGMSGIAPGGEWELSWSGQYGERRQQQYLNGGGTIPSFTGSAGRLWADNDLTASRQTVSAGYATALSDQLSLRGVASYNVHGRKIDELFPTRLQRPAAVLDEEYAEVTGLLLATYRAGATTDIFAAYSRTHEPPTWDVLLVNANGTGSGAALVDGANPRRPVIAEVGDQTADTIEAGVRGEKGALSFDITAYYSWLNGEIVSTTDPVTQTVASVGNADRSTRLGIEAYGLWNATRNLDLSATWNWTQARFDQDPRFGDNHLPIIPDHVVTLKADWRFGRGFFASATAEIVPEGGYADYANTVRADGYETLGLRAGWQGGRVTIFAEGRNVTNENYVSTVIAAQNNLASADAATFSPGEGAQVLIGIETKF